MTIRYQRQFRIRHYECDAYGHLNHVNYVRYMQEAALEASADVGWDIPRYQHIKRIWFIRETDIEYLLPLHYGEEVLVTTWVADFRRVQSRRMYEFHRPDGQLVARANSNWVFLDSENRRPAPIPEELIHDFMPQPTLKNNSYPRFPHPTPEPEGVFLLNKRVEWRDIDTQGHVNNAAYMSYFEDAATQVGRVYGWPMERMIEAGFAIIMRRLRILYLLPAQMDEEIEVACWVSDIKRATALRHYVIRTKEDGQSLARGHALLVCLDLHKQRPMRVPQDFLDDFFPNIAEDTGIKI